MELMQANAQWANRPADERFVSLDDMAAHFATLRQQSAGRVAPSRSIRALPAPDNKGLTIEGAAGVPYAPTHWAFGQLATLAGAPAGYLRTLPSPMAADCLNYGLNVVRPVEDVGLLLQRNGHDTLRAATGPRYGRIWNADILDGMTKVFGDGVSGEWTVPGEFGKAITVTKDNTTLFAGDRDMFVFLADEHNRIEIPNRRDGRTGALARGFFVWNSEVGSNTFGISTFLFDYVCCNRIVWGAQDVNTIKLRHTASAPVKFLEEIAPALHTYANTSTASVTRAIAQARSARIDATGPTVEDFLAARFSKRMAETLIATHLLEEQRPIETLWDAATAITAHARSIPHQDERVALERKAGDILALAA